MNTSPSPSKQPCVWVVEMKWSGGWLELHRYTFRSRGLARNARQRLLNDRIFGDNSKLRVAKYVRVEPKKKKGRTR